MPSHSLQAVVLDWAGTTVDFGSRGPTRVFIEVFRQRGVEISEAEARGPMGRSKRDHIAAVANLPRVAQAWQKVFGNPPQDRDVQAMYDDFLPLQKETLKRFSDVIPGVPEAIADCRQRGLKIGSTTGYTRELMEVVVPLAAAAGYAPDVVVCSDDVQAGRPAPWMVMHAAEQLGVYPMDRILVVDDTPVGIEAGRNAGATTVAIIETGNAMGLSQEELDGLATPARDSRCTAARRQFEEVGADHFLGSLAELPRLLARMMPA